MVTRAALEQIVDIARRAGGAITSRARTGVVASSKADRSPVTEADRDAHHLIKGLLTTHYPSIPIVSEEGAVPAYDVRQQWARFWLVDPLDGTKEFLSGNGEYTVNVALVEDTTPVLGVVFAPALNVVYYGGRGLGAWKQSGPAEPVRLASSPPAAGAPLVVVESRSHPSAELEAFLTTIPVARRVQAGSSLKFCWLAEGQADIYPRFGRTMEWDTAAGDCVFRNSGIRSERASPLTYNTPSLSHERFVIGW